MSTDIDISDLTHEEIEKYFPKPPPLVRLIAQSDIHGNQEYNNYKDTCLDEYCILCKKTRDMQIHHELQCLFLKRC